MEDIRTKQAFFTRQELGTVIFSIVLTVFMIGMLIFGTAYKSAPSDPQPGPAVSQSQDDSQHQPQ